MERSTAVPLREAEQLLDLTALRGVRFHHVEHLECLLYEEIARHIRRLPLHCFLGSQSSRIERRHLVDLQVIAILPQSVVGKFVLTFAENFSEPELDTVNHGDPFAFLFERKTGRIRFRSQVR